MRVGLLFTIWLRLRGLAEDEITLRRTTFALVALDGIDIDTVVYGHIRLEAIIGVCNLLRLHNTAIEGLYATKCWLLLLLLINDNRALLRRLTLLLY